MKCKSFNATHNVCSNQSHNNADSEYTNNTQLLGNLLSIFFRGNLIPVFRVIFHSMTCHVTLNEPISE